MIPSRDCPLCASSSENAKLFLAQNIDSNKISRFSFSSRKTPEYMSHRMLQCAFCDLVYADTPPPEEALAESYSKASYDSSEEADDAAEIYSLAIQELLTSLSSRQSALEIGTGTGIFLRHLKEAGFLFLTGVEPSQAAIDSAKPDCRPWILPGTFNENDFDPNSFDLICCFMTMEHLSDPLEIAKSALRLLKPGGIFLTVTHDYRSSVNRLLGRYSPIVDIEHLQLFSKKSIHQLFTRAGFIDIGVKNLINRYSVRYWIRLSPLPFFVKLILNKIYSVSFLSRVRIRINVGNILAFGRKKA